MRGSRKRKPLIWASAREVWKWTVLFSCVLALPDMEAPHLGVSSGGVEVDGGFAKVAGNSREKKHKVEENYSSEVSPPCREKQLEFVNSARDFPRTFDMYRLYTFHDKWFHS